MFTLAHDLSFSTGQIGQKERRRSLVVPACSRHLAGMYVFSGPTGIAAGARDLSRRNVSTAQTRPQRVQSILRSPTPLRTEVRAPSLLRSRGEQAKHIRQRADSAR